MVDAAIAITHRLGGPPKPAPLPGLQSHYAATLELDGIEYQIKAVYEPPPHYAWNRLPQVSLARNGVGEASGYLVTSSFRAMLGLFSEDARVWLLGFLNRIDVLETERLNAIAVAETTQPTPGVIP